MTFTFYDQNFLPQAAIRPVVCGEADGRAGDRVKVKFTFKTK